MKGYNPLNGTSPQQTLFIKRAINKLKAALSNYQKKLTAGDGIKISNDNVISTNVVDVQNLEVSTTPYRYVSIVDENGKAKIPPAGLNTMGTVYVSGTANERGIQITDGRITLGVATTSQIISLAKYAIMPENFVIALINLSGSFVMGNNPLSADKALNWWKFLNIENKILPEFPEESGTFLLKYDNTGSVPSLSWVAEI